MRTLVTFRSSLFNTTQTKDYFINAGCFGDDVCKWLMGEFHAKGVETDQEPGQEDFGWYFNFNMPTGSHCIVIGYRPGDNNEEGIWIGWLERKCGFIGSLLGGRKRGISTSAIEMAHQILSSSERIQNVRWHVQGDFDQGKENLGSSTP